MTLKNKLTTMISDFAGISKTPDFKPVKDERRASTVSNVPIQAPAKRRESVNIVVGTAEIPVLGRERSDSSGSLGNLKKNHVVKGQRRCSEPCIDSTDLLRSKKLTRKRSDGESIPEESEVDHNQMARNSLINYRI